MVGQRGGEPPTASILALTAELQPLQIRTQCSHSTGAPELPREGVVVGRQRDVSGFGELAGDDAPHRPAGHHAHGKASQLDEERTLWRETRDTARRKLARTLWAAFRRHPWLAPALSLTRPQPLAGAMPYVEWVLRALDGLADHQTTFTVHLTVFNYVRGIAVNLKMEAEAEALSGMTNEQWLNAQEPALRAITAEGAFPKFEEMVVEEYDFDLDALFEFGLQRLLDGLAVLFKTHH